jgi:hypothetical protein
MICDSQLQWGTFHRSTTRSRGGKAVMTYLAHYPKITNSTLALVIKGLSAGTVVRCIKRAHAPPGSSARSFGLQPLWAVDVALTWIEPKRMPSGLHARAW